MGILLEENLKNGTVIYLFILQLLCLILLYDYKQIDSILKTFTVLPETRRRSRASSFLDILPGSPSVFGQHLNVPCLQISLPTQVHIYWISVNFNKGNNNKPPPRTLLDM